MQPTMRIRDQQTKDENFFLRNNNPKGTVLGIRALFTLFLLLAAAASAAQAQTFTTLASFDQSDGAYPKAAVIQGFDGKLYSTTSSGLKSDGTVFKVSESGTIISLHYFCSQANCPDGNRPTTALVETSGGLFYGTTPAISNIERGTIYKITASGALTTIYHFCAQTACADGKAGSTLIVGNDGNLYGTTAAGNYSGCGTSGCGTVFKITQSGILTTLYAFCEKSTCVDHGYGPNAALAKGSDGNFYGTTVNGGANHLGTIFKITPSGAMTTLYNFCALANCADGASPFGALVQATDGNFYGTTASGGFEGSSFCSGEGCGTAFKITPGGELTTIHDFCSDANCSDGLPSRSSPNLIQASDGNFYGVSDIGIYQLTPEGATTVLDDSSYEVSNLLQATDGNIYGTLAGGGQYSFGEVFRLSVGLGPFVEPLPASGKVGAAISILGNNLTGASQVTFNGIDATFKVISATRIIAAVPAGATSGTIEVTTPSGTLSSNPQFQVR